MEKDYLDRMKYVRNGAYHLKAYDKKIHTKKTVDAAIDWFCEHEQGKEVSIIDIGSGEGLYVRELTKRGYNVCGVDACKEAVAIAEQEGVKGISFGYANDFEGFYDVCYMFDSFEHFINPIDVAKYVSSRIKKNIYIINPLWPSENHFDDYNVDKIVGIFKDFGWKLADYQKVIHKENMYREYIQLAREH